ncbi:MAG TPA: thiol peroxidase [Chitinophagales bacterium]|nr:thiol peroxidase [Chitinophagales bacterium]
MANITLKGNKIHTQGELPKIGEQAPDFKLTTGELAEKSIADFKGKNIIFNIFPSIDTGTCAISVRKFNEEAADLENTVVLCVSKDLPFAQQRFFDVEGLKNVITLSEFRDNNFSDAYQVKITDGPLEGLMSRAVVVVNDEGKVIYTEQVPEIVEEPNYQKALDALK